MPKTLLRFTLNFGRHMLRVSYSMADKPDVATIIKRALGTIDPLPGKGRKDDRSVKNERRGKSNECSKDDKS